MDSVRSREHVSAALALGICLLAGLVLGAWVLGAQIKAMRLADRYVTVKGLVERTVKSDRAVWAVSFKTAGNDLSGAFEKSEADKNTVLGFFAQQGITAGEVSVGQIRVVDRQTNEYGGNMDKGSCYILTQTVTISSNDVDKISRAGGKTSALVQAGVVLAGGENGQQGGIVYQFSGLNALKPGMITEATRNARDSANRFAADSGSKVGSIRSANQGVFSISANEPGNAASAGAEGGGGDAQADASIMKKVRVVSTIDYYLEK